MRMIQPWLRYPLCYVAGPDDRSPASLIRALAQLEVQANPRYTPHQQGKGDTYCNIYLWDATRALLAEIPHWVGTAGAIVQDGQGTELSALGVIGWLRCYGSDHGWRELALPDACARAALGYPAVASWENPTPGGASHVAMLLPPLDGECRIAQAGGSNLWDVPGQSGFGAVWAHAQFWTHD